MGVESGGFDEIIQEIFPPSPALAPRVVYRVPPYQSEEPPVTLNALVLAFEIGRFLEIQDSRIACRKPELVEVQAEPQADDEAAVSSAQRLGAIVAALALLAGLAAVPTAAGRSVAAEPTTSRSGFVLYEREANAPNSE